MFLANARPSPRHRLAGAVPHFFLGAPANLFRVPLDLEWWGNRVDGDCCTAEEAAAKAVADPQIAVPSTVAVAWAAAHGFLNGATLIDVIDQMEKAGFLIDGKTYDDGAPRSVDWTDALTLQSALAVGPVKIGVAAAQLQNVPDIGTRNGWVATGFKPDENLDHCIGLWGFGPMGWLAEQFKIALPAGVEPDQRQGDAVPLR
jgi:hypothetical protein